MTHARFSHQFSMSSLASNEEVRILLRRLRERLQEFGVTEPTCASAETVLAEALNNITEHAYSEQQDGPIEVSAEIGTGKVRFTLSDRGTPIPGCRLPRGKPQDTKVPLQDLPEGGFGWLLIRDLTSSVTYDQDESGNHLTLTLPNAPAS